MKAFICLLLLLLLQPLTALADGCYVPNNDSLQHHLDISEPEQKVFICHDGNKEQMVLQVSYKGNVSDFCWLVPTPSTPKVAKVSAPVFHILHETTALNPNYWLYADENVSARITGPTMGRGDGTVSERLQVDVVEKKPVGIYDITVIRARNEDDLITWLKKNGYGVSPSLAPVIADYIHRGWTFTAMKINPRYQKSSSEKLKEGVLESIALSFVSDKPVYPLKISALNKNKTRVLIYVLSRHIVKADGFKTECSFYRAEYLGVEEKLKPAITEVDPKAARQIFSGYTYLTKLTAKLRPEQMTKDVTFDRAATDTTVETAYAPFWENTRMLLLMYFLYLTQLPTSLMVTYMIVSHARSGKKHILGIPTRDVALHFTMISLIYTMISMGIGLISGFIAIVVFVVIVFAWYLFGGRSLHWT